MDYIIRPIQIDDGETFWIIVIGIRVDYQGWGIGSMSFTEIDSWDYDKKITRLALAVMCANKTTKHLDEKYGFFVEDIIKKYMIVNGIYR